MNVRLMCILSVWMLFLVLGGCTCGDTGIRQFECDDHSECKTNQACKEGQCVLDDEDGDGFPSRNDCDDKDARVYPGRNEVCDNKKDDNCNDKIDELPCRCDDGQSRECGKEEGTCTRGTQICNNGKWGECKGGIDPARELCNGVDDDCDGKVDEDFADLGDPCEVGKGECKAKGTYKCAADRQALECDAQEGTPQDEICDEKDNDCDGLIDEVKECQKRFVRASTFAAVCQKVSNDKVTFFGTLAQSTPLHEANVASTSNGRTLRGGFLTQVPLQASP